MIHPSGAGLLDLSGPIFRFAPQPFCGPPGPGLLPPCWLRKSKTCVKVTTTTSESWSLRKDGTDYFDPILGLRRKRDLYWEQSAGSWAPATPASPEEALAPSA
jgi:hypothetical protein